MANINSEVLICSGMHQWQHGRIEHIETATEIPFAQVSLRGTKGQILQRSGAYVPLKYCVELDDATCQAVAAQAKAVRKAELKAIRAAAKELVGADEPADEIDWA